MLPEVLRGVGIIDSHHHFWQLGRFPYRWLAPSAPPARFGDKASIQRDYLPPDYLHDMTGLPLVGSVHVQANCGAADPVDETRWLQEMSARTGWPSAAVAEIDLLDPSASVLVERHAEYSILKGFRTPVAWDDEGRWHVASQPNVLSDKAVNAVVPQISKAGLTLEMVVVPSQLVEVAEFSTRHPDLTIVINHFGTLEPSLAGNAETWRSGIELLGPSRNVFLKLSGLWTADRNWSAKTLQPFIRHALQTFGANRVMWGSNLPVERVNCPVSQQIEQLSIMFSNQPREQLLQVFRTTAEKVYRLDVT